MLRIFNLIVHRSRGKHISVYTFGIKPSRMLWGIATFDFKFKLLPTVKFNKYPARWVKITFLIMSILPVNMSKTILFLAMIFKKNQLMSLGVTFVYFKDSGCVTEVG